MIDNIIYVPLRRRNKELYKYLVYQLNYTDTLYAAEISDTANKYKGPDQISKEATKQILSEFGLKTIADLLDSSDSIDFNSIAAYASYLSLLKGSRSGYETVIRLLGFDFTLVEWWEANPKRKPNTIEFDVLLDSSIVPRPYDTFQKIKKFTAEYVFPIIDPLAYSLSINFSELAILHHGYAHPTYLCIVPEVTIDESLLFSKTRYIVVDELGDKWSIRVNNLGQLQAFATTVGEAVPRFSIQRPDSSLAEIKVNSSGVIFAEDAAPEVPQVFEWSIAGRDDTLWYFMVSDLDVVSVTNSP